MSDGLAPMLAVLRAFAEGELPVDDFVDRYLRLWDSVRAEQDAAIASHPTMTATLHDLDERHRRGEISADAYLAGAHEQLAQLEGLSVPPGGQASRVLSNLSVEADAYRADAEESDGLYATEEELRDQVRSALATLAPA